MIHIFILTRFNMVDCVICFENTESELRCDNDSNPHTLCHNCVAPYLNNYVLTGEQMTKMLKIQDAVQVQCTHCTSQYSLTDMLKHCDSTVKDTMFQRILEMRLLDRARQQQVDTDRQTHKRTMPDFEKKCPHCSRVFADFDGCIAVTCSGEYGCGGHFCGACFQGFPDDQAAHRHASSQHGNFFMPQEQIEQWNLRYFRQIFWNFIDSLPDEPAKNHVLAEKRKFLADVLGSDFDVARNRRPPTYGVYINHTRPGANPNPNPQLNAGAPIHLRPDLENRLQLARPSQIYQVYKLVFRHLGVDYYSEIREDHINQLFLFIERLTQIQQYLTIHQQWRANGVTYNARNISISCRNCVVGDNPDQMIAFLNDDFVDHLKTEIGCFILIQELTSQQVAAVLKPQHLRTPGDRKLRSQCIPRIKHIFDFLDSTARINAITRISHDLGTSHGDN